MYTLKMTFKTDENKKYIMKVKNCNPNLDNSKVGPAMQDIINYDVVETKLGNLIEPSKALIVESNVKSYSFQI